MAEIWTRWAPADDTEATAWLSSFELHSRSYFNVVTKLFDSSLITPSFFVAIFDMLHFMRLFWTQYHLWTGAFSAQVGEHMMKKIKDVLSNNVCFGQELSLQVLNSLSRATLILPSVDAHPDQQHTKSLHPRQFSQQDRCSVCFSPHLSARGRFKSCVVIDDLDALLEGATLPPHLDLLKKLSPAKDQSQSVVTAEQPFHPLPPATRPALSCSETSQPVVKKAHRTKPIYQ